jgi:hypothetical protein
MTNKQQPRWRPISELPLIASLIDGTLANTEEQYQTFSEIKNKPHVLDDAIVERTIKLYRAQLNDHCLFEEQIRLWSDSELTSRQRQEVERLSAGLVKLKEKSEAILKLMDTIKDRTIDKILAKDDIKIAIDVLSGKLKL